MKWKEDRLKLTKPSAIQVPREIVDACLKWARGNDYNGEFNNEAIKRMVAGSWQLRKFLDITKGDNVLEVGPFFNPQVNPERNPGVNVVYWENEEDVISHLARKYGEKYRPLYVDLDKLKQNLNQLERATRNKLSGLVNGGSVAKGFDAVIASQVLNYINFENFLYFVKNFLRPGGVIYINNVAHYGIAEYFSQQRPESNNALIEELEQQGFEIIDAIKLPKPKTGENFRMIIKAKLRP